MKYKLKWTEDTDKEPIRGYCNSPEKDLSDLSWTVVMGVEKKCKQYKLILKIITDC